MGWDESWGDRGLDVLNGQMDGLMERLTDK